DRDALLIEITNVGVAAQKPEQFVNDRFDVELLGCQKRKSRACGTQIKTCLRPKDRQCACAGAIGAGLTFFKDEPEKIVILPHAKSYRSKGFRKKNSSVVVAVPAACF